MVSVAPEVVVFGGTGFLGRCAVRHLLARDCLVRVASRNPERGPPVFRQARGVKFVRTDVADAASVDAVLAGAYAAINAVSLYVERGSRTFHGIHVEAAARVAECAARAGVSRLVHVSGIGADPRSASAYIRSRGEGESAVRAAFAGVTLIRPAVMFGPDDAFLGPLIRLLRMFPVFPMFGAGKTALQPAYVDDVAAAIVRAIDLPEPVRLCELAGPRVFTYESLLQTIARHVGLRRVLIPVPFGIWRTLAFAAEALPRPPITRNQVELMMVDNTASPDLPGFGRFGIDPRDVEPVLETMMGRDPRGERVEAQRDGPLIETDRPRRSPPAT